MIEILRETAIVAGAGVILALAANAVSPAGLVLSRNYFPSGAPIPPAATNGTAPSTNPPVEVPTPGEQLRAAGLQSIDRLEAVALHGDDRFARQLIVFIDARDADHFRAGHIPGAYELDPYHPEKSLASLLPVCQAADQIVIYCHGGECEDSRFAALMLRDAGIGNLKLRVYLGGFSDWMTHQLPIETGDRGSGSLTKPGL
jgi:rhodanese-related sulfurtransferase